MTIDTHRTERRLRAKIIGFGLDGRDGPRRVLTGKECVVIGGSEGTHAELVETMLRLQDELERLGRRLGDVTPDELADLALRIDSPELHTIALQLARGLERRGRTFEESTAQELTELATGRLA